MTGQGEDPGRVGVVLLQIGGPRSLDGIQPFLEDMFLDPALIDLPIPARIRPWLARRLSTWRAKAVRPLYRSIGGKSPIVETTRRQARALERELRPLLDCRVFVAMRYGAPSTNSAVRAVAKAGLDRLLLLPLYPQYSTATTGSSIREWDRQCNGHGVSLPSDRIDSYHSDPGYVGAMARRVDEALGRFDPDSDPQVVFSAHGLPEKLVRRGDPYQEQIEESARLIWQQCTSERPYVLCYQSRFGPQRWLAPSLTDTLSRLARDAVESILVVPISFVSDHLETLSEIGIEARDLAIGSGIRQFRVTEGLNDDSEFIASLAGLVLEKLSVRPRGNDPVFPESAQDPAP